VGSSGLDSYGSEQGLLRGSEHGNEPSGSINCVVGGGLFLD